MREERLLERLRSRSENPDARSPRSDHDLLVHSVLNYMRKILNTRQGSVPIALDFGVPDFGSMASRFSTDNSKAVEDIEDSLREVIRRYEPRLKSVKLRFLKTEDFDFTVRFQVAAELVTDKGTIPIVFRTLLSPDGEVDVIL